MEMVLTEILEPVEIVKGKYGDAIRLKFKAGIASISLTQEKLKVIGEITMMAWIYSPETWNNKRMTLAGKNCHFVVPVGWAHCYGIASADAGNGPEIFLFLRITDRGEVGPPGVQNPA